MKSSHASLSRRCFLSAVAPGIAALAVVRPSAPGASAANSAQNAAWTLEITDVPGAEGVSETPAEFSLVLSEPLRQAAREGRLTLSEIGRDAGRQPSFIPLQCAAAEAGGNRLTLSCLLPPGPPGRRQFRLESAPRRDPAPMNAGLDAASGQFDISEQGRPVLRYNYKTLEPGKEMDSIAPGNRIYARPRSNYIHPFHGLNGEPLTHDWSKDHPHHRGIYWAWPEVDWRGQRGDLHALQKVFARPTGKCLATSGAVFGQVEAENLWRWEDRDAIVREQALIRVWRSGTQGRVVDLEFRFAALEEPVLLARRGASHYGGLNIRLGPVQRQRIRTRTDPPETVQRLAWGLVEGTFAGAAAASGLLILQHAGNPAYPGDWIQYPELNWLQPTFPASGARHELKQGQTLVLRYRLAILPGDAATDAACAAHWRRYQALQLDCSLKRS